MSAVFSQNLRRVDFQDFLGLLQLDRLQLTVVCCNRRVCVNTTPYTSNFRTKNLFKQCEPLQGILVQIKSEQVWCIDNQ